MWAHVCHPACVEVRSNWQGSVLLPLWGPRDRTQAVRVGSRCLHPQAEVVWYLSSVSPSYFPLQWDSFSVVGIFIVVGLSLFLEHVATHCFTQKYHGYLSVLYWLGLICVDTRLSRCPSRLLHCTLPILLSVLKASTFFYYTHFYFEGTRCF